jgi:competence protein ComGC
MNIKSLTLKNTLTEQNTGEQYFDLSAPSFRYDVQFGVKAIHYVLPDQAGRIDLISEIYYGSGEYIDAICVTNNIFNPFSVNEGDVLVIPNILNNEDQVYSRPKTASRPNLVQGQFIDTDRQSQKDQSRIERLKAKGSDKKSGVNSPLPPNVLQQGQAAKTFKGGNIQLGTNLPTRNTNRS